MEYKNQRNRKDRPWPGLAMVLAMLIPVGCSQSGSKTAAATASNKCSPKKASASQASGTKKTSSSKKSNADAELTEDESLALLAEPNYKDDIQPVFKAKCATPGCHVPNAQPPALHTYEAVIAGTAIADSIAQMKDTTARKMPPSGAMDSAFLTTFETWSKGKPPKESATLTSSKDSDDEESPKSSSKKTTKVTKKGSEDAEAEEEYVCVKKSQVKEEEEEETDSEPETKTSKSGSSSKSSKLKLSSEVEE